MDKYILRYVPSEASIAELMKLAYKKVKEQATEVEKHDNNQASQSSANRITHQYVDNLQLFDGYYQGNILKTKWGGIYLAKAGICHFNNGVTYAGEVQDNRLGSNGKYTWKDGTTYIGTVRNGLRNGNGITQDSRGNCLYDGQWLNGKRHGLGKLEYSVTETIVYEGTWKNDLKHGYGKQTYSSGSVYEGQWSMGKQSGYGKMTWKQSNEEYKGQWLNGLPNGYGETIYFNPPQLKADSMGGQRFLNRYCGEMHNGMRHGEGVFYYSDGSSYEGQWIGNKKCGAGVYTFPDGTQFKGTLNNGKINESHKQEFLNCFLGLTHHSIYHWKISDMFCALASSTSDSRDTFISRVHHEFLRHRAQFHEIYERYRAAPLQSKQDKLSALTLRDLWSVLADVNILSPTYTLVCIDRSIAKALMGVSFPPSTQQKVDSKTFKLMSSKSMESDLNVVKDETGNDDLNNVAVTDVAKEADLENNSKGNEDVVYPSLQKMKFLTVHDPGQLIHPHEFGDVLLRAIYDSTAPEKSDELFSRLSDVLAELASKNVEKEPQTQGELDPQLAPALQTVFDVHSDKSTTTATATKEEIRLLDDRLSIRCLFELLKLTDLVRDTSNPRSPRILNKMGGDAPSLKKAPKPVNPDFSSESAVEYILSEYCWFSPPEIIGMLFSEYSNLSRFTKEHIESTEAAQTIDSRTSNLGNVKAEEPETPNSAEQTSTFAESMPRVSTSSLPAPLRIAMAQRDLKQSLPLSQKPSKSKEPTEQTGNNEARNTENTVSRDALNQEDIQASKRRSTKLTKEPHTTQKNKKEGISYAAKEEKHRRSKNDDKTNAKALTRQASTRHLSKGSGGPQMSMTPSNASSDRTKSFPDATGTKQPDAAAAKESDTDVTKEPDSARVAQAEPQLQLSQLVENEISFYELQSLFKQIVDKQVQKLEAKSPNPSNYSFVVSYLSTKLNSLIT